MFDPAHQPISQVTSADAKIITPAEGLPNSNLDRRYHQLYETPMDHIPRSALVKYTVSHANAKSSPLEDRHGPL